MDPRFPLIQLFFKFGVVELSWREMGSVEMENKGNRRRWEGRVESCCSVDQQLGPRFASRGPGKEIWLLPRGFGHSWASIFAMLRLVVV